MRGTPTKAQKDAVKWLNDHGRTGVLTKAGYLLAEGEWGHNQPVVWLRLVAMGLVEASVDTEDAIRISLTEDGRKLIEG